MEDVEADTTVENPGICPKSHCCLLRHASFQHFLFNALNSAVSLCAQNPNQAAELLILISDYLRAGLQEENTIIPLQVELDYVRSYLSIQKVRFGDRLEIEYDILPGISCPVPPFVLLHIVDNGIRHGIMKRKSGGRIKVSVSRAGIFARIVVEDNGIGIPERLLPQLLLETHPEWSLPKLNKVLYTYCGAGLRIESPPEGGTRVCLEIAAAG